MIDLKEFLKRVYKKSQLEQSSDELISVNPSPSSVVPSQIGTINPPSIPDSTIGRGIEYSTTFKAWKKRQGGQWKVLGYYLNILNVDPSSVEGQALEQAGYKYSRNSYSKSVKTKEDIDRYQNELDSIGNQFGCSFSNQWLEESREAFPDNSFQIDTVKDEVIEQKVENVLNSQQIDDMKKKEISEGYIRAKIAELAQMTDEASKDEFIMKFLAMSPEFHDYSFVNRILMLLQNRNVSNFVAGAKQWADPRGKFKRKIKDGETPMHIFAPEQNKIYISAAKIIRDKMEKYIISGNAPWANYEELGDRLGIDNYYAKSFMAYSLMVNNGNINRAIEYIDKQIERFKNYKSIYYGTKKSGGYPVFKIVDVYDISQTEVTSPDSFQEPDTDVWMVKKNEPDSKAQLLTRAAVDWAKTAKYQVGDKWETGINVELATKTGEAGGWSRGSEIAINEMSLGWRQFSTVVHEIAHSLLHFGPDRTNITRQQAEIEAEATAFVVLNFFGFTETRFAANYLALHKAIAKDIDVLDRYNKIDYAARNIIKGVQSNLNNSTVAGNWFNKFLLKKYSTKPIDILFY